MERVALISEKVDTSNAPVSEGELKRIFIGGLGAGVTSDDMVKAFSTLGSVHSVEFVRTNGRNFAFMDFGPNSVKSMANLFSTYNGCTWKGGKLKLEMANEHYLTRLKREWAEDAKLASAPPAIEENLKFDKHQFPDQENSKIQIFFPKLRKVKPLPFKGTGKHKYSFRRIEVPPLPIHFCDCEEHSKALETTSQNFFFPLSTVVREKERNIINNVLNKFVGGDTVNTSSGRNMQAVSGHDSPSNEESHCKEQKVSDTDDDDLVMNIGAGAGKDIFMQLKGAMTPSPDQESGFGNPHLVHNKEDSSKRKKSEPTDASSIKTSKRARSVSANRLSKCEPSPAITPKNVTSVLSVSSEGQTHTPELLSETPAAGKQEKPNLERRLLSANRRSKCEPSAAITMKNVTSVLSVSSEGQTHTPEVLSEIPATGKLEKPDFGIAQPESSHSWVQKSSWKNLVEGSGSSSFTLSTLLSGIAPTALTKIPAKSNASDTSVNPGASQCESFGESRKFPHNIQINPVMNPKSLPSKDSLHDVQEKATECRTIVQEQRKETAVLSFGGVCPFMRSAESENQWSKAKAALSGFIKKKSNEGKGSKFVKGMAPSKW